MGWGGFVRVLCILGFFVYGCCDFCWGVVGMWVECVEVVECDDLFGC